MVPVDLVNKLRVDTAEIAMASGGANVGYEILTTAMPSVQPILCRMLT